MEKTTASVLNRGNGIGLGTVRDSVDKVNSSEKCAEIPSSLHRLRENVAVLEQEMAELESKLTPAMKALTEKETASNPAMPHTGIILVDQIIDVTEKIMFLARVVRITTNRLEL